MGGTIIRDPQVATTTQTKLLGLLSKREKFHSEITAVGFKVSTLEIHSTK